MAGVRGVEHARKPDAVRLRWWIAAGSWDRSETGDEGGCISQRARGSTASRRVALRAEGRPLSTKSAAPSAYARAGRVIRARACPIAARGSPAADGSGDHFVAKPIARMTPGRQRIRSCGAACQSRSSSLLETGLLVGMRSRFSQRCARELGRLHAYAPTSAWVGVGV